MKPNRLWLAIASSVMASQLMAGEAVFYVTEDGEAVRDLAVAVDGKKKLVGKSGFVSFDVPAGSHTVELSQFGEYLGEFDFDTASEEQNAEIQVEMIGGEALPEINVFTPGQEAEVALGQISGYLESDDTGGPISGARVSVEGTEQGVVTDEDGFFSFELPRGEYNLLIADPNYGKRDVSGIRVMGNVNTGVNLNMSLEGDGVIEEVVAVGTYVPSTATAQERDSSAVLDSIGAEQFSRFGDSDAASALKRVAGVSVNDEFAVVRGMSGRYISSTLNGALMPSTDPLRRDVPLDLFPASILGGIDIQKSFTPDMPGDSTGGAIAMTTRGAPEETGGKASVTLGFNTRTTFNDAVTYHGGGSDWTGADDGTREEPSLIASGTNGGLESVGRNLSTAQAIRASDQFEHDLSVHEVEAKPERGFSFSYGDLIENEDSNIGLYGALQYKDEWEVRHDAEIDDVDGTGNYQRSKRKIDLSGYFFAGIDKGDFTVNSQSILLRKTDDTTRVTRKLDTDLETESYILQWVERQFISQQFSGDYFFNLLGEDKLSWNLGYAQTTRDEPDRRSYTYARSPGSDSPLRFQGVAERRFSELTEDAITLGVDYEGEVELSDLMLLKVKAGLMQSAKEREVAVARYTNTPIVTLDTSLPIDQILSSENINNGSFLYDGATTSTDSYDATDDITAAYLSGELDADSVSVLFGTRFEQSEQTLEYPDQNSSDDNKLDESKVLPALSINWRVTEDAQLRFSATQTVSRPGITERSESEVYDPDTDDRIIGNPDLEISDITNLDARAEYYFSDDESVTFAVFYKDIDKPIERVVGESRNSTTYTNAESATVQGAEIDFRVNTLDTDSFSGFVAGNVSYIDSEVDLGDGRAAILEGSDTRPLQGQSEYLANIQLGFDHLPTGQSLTLLGNYFDDRILTVGRGDLENEVEDARAVWDLVYRYDVNDVFTVKGKIENLGDQKISFSRGGKEIESYYEGSTMKISVDYAF
ncbi:TonB-dependent receptor [Bacterioplanoides sp. SCSIO 12839]|uniref:TonB-dependent receptor n=1 Tax=Bacterioplanoides sp. SCSIO 12839 TaxID=2829569 RepID=UPI002103A36D|nr:TonB-dependent receptor [Bacterioplanoides sp. SCSIO 12839]UTW47425.1 TonB-dependent receptor [Bacterioplanoides sp. SCSIO 12839]